MNTAEFLRLLWPDEGYKAIAIPVFDGTTQSKKWKHKLFETVEGAATTAEELSAQGLDVYFGLASLESKYYDDGNGRAGVRIRENIKHIKSFWLDIDCRSGKEYPTYEEGLYALNAFVVSTGFPPPYVVSSGGGLHCYWPLKEPLIREEWRKIADHFKLFCDINGLRYDASRTTDSSSVLRVLGTRNWKYENSAVTLAQVGDVISVERFKEAVNYFSVPHEAMETLNALQLPKKEYPPSKAKDVIAKCQQIQWAVLNQKDTPEPLWRSTLSVLRLTVNGRKHCHNASKDHPNYDEVETDKKIESIEQAIDGPHSCETFKNLRPSGCEGCVHAGKIKSPLLLGVDFAVEEQPKIEVNAVDGDGKAVVYETVLPSPPFPYYINGKREVWIRADESTEDAVDELIASCALYPVEILDDVTRDLQIQGGEVRFIFQDPRDKWQEMRIDKALLSKPDRMKEIFNINNLFPSDKEATRTFSYMKAFLNKIHSEKESTLMVQHMGWVANQQHFALGERIVTPNEIKETKPSRGCYPIATFLKQRGSLQAWSDAYSAYFSRAGMERQAIASLAIWGSPLMPFSRQDNLMINLQGKTGLGKTTALMFIVSAYGDPQSQLLMKWKDTGTSVFARAGIMHNLPLAIDEITHSDPQKVSDHIMSMSDGRGRNRAKQDGTERENTAFWNNITVYSSNIGMAELLASYKADSSPEMVRLLEFKINERPFTKQEADVFIDAIRSNYGFSGLRYSQILVKNKDEVAANLRKYIDLLEKKWHIQSHERFWSEGLGACFYGARIAQQNGLHTLNVDALEDFFYKELVTIRGDIKSNIRTSADILAAFINEHMMDTLVMKQENVVTQGQRNALELNDSSIVRLPRNSLVATYIEETKKFTCTKSAFAEFCIKHKANPRQTLLDLRLEKILINDGETSRLGKGTKIPSVNSRNIVFDLSFVANNVKESLVQT